MEQSRAAQDSRNVMALKVGKHVPAKKPRVIATAIDSATNDALPVTVVVLQERFGKAVGHCESAVGIHQIISLGSLVVEETSFLQIPAVVVRGQDLVNLFDGDLADFAAVEIAVNGIKPHSI